MKAAVITAAGKPPMYADFNEPSAADGFEVVSVTASALSNLSKARSSEAHYSSAGAYPSVAGVDGVGRTAGGRRVYFALPEPPFGALAERSLVRSENCIPVPDEVDDVTAAAIANPGMSVWAALVERAGLRRGETVLINGGTSTAGRLAIQVAKYLGAGRVIATGRNAGELQDLLPLGADSVLPFALGPDHPEGAARFDKALVEEFGRGIDVVVDYLWGESARTIIVAVAKAVEDGHPVRFVQVGAVSSPELSLPGAALRSSAIQLMGSGLKSVPFDRLLRAIGNIFAAVRPAGLRIDRKAMPLAQVAAAWEQPAKPRIVITIP